MKKAALTIGLFSLAMVATSFTALETTTVNLVQKVYFEKNIEPKGSSTGGQTRKTDGLMSIEESTIAGKNLNSAVSQSLGLNKKQD